MARTIPLFCLSLDNGNNSLCGDHDPPYWVREPDEEVHRMCAMCRRVSPVQASVNHAQRRFDRERMRVRVLANELYKTVLQLNHSGMHCDNMIRASGDCVCAVCGFIYHDHPSFDPKCPTLVVLCDGTYVKL